MLDYLKVGVTEPFGTRMRIGSGRMRCLVTTLAMFLALCAPAFASGVTNVSVANDVPTRATGARTIYVVGFTTSAPGVLAGSDRIRVTFPIGTGFTGWSGRHRP